MRLSRSIHRLIDQLSVKLYNCNKIRFGVGGDDGNVSSGEPLWLDGVMSLLRVMNKAPFRSMIRIWIHILDLMLFYATNSKVDQKLLLDT